MKRVASWASSTDGQSNEGASVSYPTIAFPPEPALRASEALEITTRRNLLRAARNELPAFNPCCAVCATAAEIVIEALRECGHPLSDDQIAALLDIDTVNKSHDPHWRGELVCEGCERALNHRLGVYLETSTPAGDA